MNVKKAWAAELRAARLRAGYATRKELAEASGIHKGTIDALERGDRSPRQETVVELRRKLPDLRPPLEVTPVVSEDARDPNGYVIHVPMDPARRAVVLAEALSIALREAQEGRSE